MFQLRQDGREPLYHKLKDAIRSNIESGIWPSNYRLPNEFEVARRFGVSRTTVRTAMADLTREGFLRRRQGQGTFVVGARPEADLARIQDLTTGLFALGPWSTHRPIRQQIISAPANIARTLNIPPRSKVVEIVRLRLERGEPILLANYHLPAARVPELRVEDFSGEVPYHFLAEHFGIHITQARTWLEPTVADEYEAKLLGIDLHAPCMLIRRLLKEDSQPVMATKMLLRGDRCRYVISWETATPSPT
jgi:GntR family transcriptional regulator